VCLALCHDLRQGLHWCDRWLNQRSRRQRADNFGADHPPSGSGVQRVLTELHKLAERMASRATETATPVKASLTTSRPAALDGSQMPEIESASPWVTSAARRPSIRPQ
jgi:hypothetical protein